MSECPDCDLAESNPFTGHFSGGCIGCEARAIAQGPGAFQREADNAELLIHEMRRARPIAAEYKRLRSLVWYWINRLKEAT